MNGAGAANDMTQIFIELVRGAFTLAAVALGSLIALLAYFRQKEYELVKQRYLEGGVDIVAAQLELATGVVSHNWARCLQICKSFRDTDVNFDLKELERGFLDFDNSQFHQIAHHRIGTLIGSHAVWDSFQLVMADFSSANAMFTKEVPEAIRLRCTTSLLSHQHDTMADAMLDDVRARHDSLFRYSMLIKALHGLSTMLEEEKLKIKAVAEFSKRPEVQQLINRIRTEFPD